MNENESQRAAIRHGEGPMLVLAGPGSGKTAVITKRVRHLTEACGVAPNAILVITFTKAAANEMRQRFLRETGAERTAVTFGTFHAVFFMVLKYAYHFDRSNIIAEEQRYMLMREILSRYALDCEDEKELIGNLLGEISAIKNSRIDVANFYSSHCGEEIFREIYRDYQAYLTRNRKIDFDDMLTYTYDLFDQRKDILLAWQKKYSYILIDEFQDINRIQYDIVRMLAGRHRNLFVVGDDDQSIYRFRGSKPELMLGFTSDYPDAEKLTLSENYRSLPGIVEVAGNVIAHNQNRFSKALCAVREGKAGISFQCFEDSQREYESVIAAIQEAIKKGVNPGRIAVLCRTNIQPRLLLEMMTERNLPFYSRERIPDLYENPIAKDFFAYLRIAQGSRSRADFLTIMNKPKRYIGRDSLCESEVTFDEWIRLYEEKPWIAQRIEKLWHDVKMLAHMNPYAAINYIRRGIGYDDYLAEYADYKGVDKENFYEVADEIMSSAKGCASVKVWFERIEEYRRKIRELARDVGEPQNAVNIATLHGAKGLEYDMVFLIDVNEGVMPYKKALLDADVEEERRLFYVGLTRARDALWLGAVRTRNNRSVEISRFVNEAGLMS